MIVEYALHKFDDDVSMGTIVLWRKEVGDSIEAGEVLLELMTEKVNIEIPCTLTGRIVALVGTVDSEVKVGDVVARIEIP
jgi:pyruvate/2-oxoglutarate dehydrogenase complex dihydrolipoamide acyltransferase (E2) component